MNLLKLILLMLSFMALTSSELQAQDVSRWSLKYLARASNLVLVANDQSLNKEPIVCQLKKNEPAKMSLNLKKIIDQRLQSLTTAEKEQIYLEAQACEKDCTCDVYSLFFEGQSSPKAKKALTELETRALHVGLKERALCAQSFGDFCQSNLSKILRRQ